MVDTPPAPSFEMVARALAQDPDELALMRDVRTHDDYVQAMAWLSALRKLRDEEAERALREQFRKR